MKSRNCDIIEDRYRRQFSKFEVRAVSQSWDIRRMQRVNLQSLQYWCSSVARQYDDRNMVLTSRAYFGYLGQRLPALNKQAFT